MLTIPKLIQKAVRKFHAYIRKRDAEKPCISCGRYHTLQAGHFYSAGNYPALRFDEDNVHGQCKKCNYFLSGNLTEYERNLRMRIGDDRVDQLHFNAAQYKRLGFKWNRFFLEEIIQKY
jgi:gamma-glutamylcyclotransferase (GGCT)/AIG2-like uncharacterized protein YtfP